MRDVIRVQAAVLERLLEEARRNRSEECCGLLAGREGVITEILPARNQLASATSFEIAPEELFRLFKQMRATGLEHLGIYHSHPKGDNAPSLTDIEHAYYPLAAYFILSLQAEAKRPIRAYSICDSRVTELTIVPVGSPDG